MEWSEFAFIMFTVIFSLAAVITIIKRYAQAESQVFPTEAYLVIGSTLMFGFVTVGLLATDLSITVYNRANGSQHEQSRFNTFMNVFWVLAYWGNLICGTFLIKFFQAYWVSGMFSRKARVKHTIKRMLFKLAILATVGLVALALAFYLIDEENLKSIQGVGLATV
jgi:hypothetical protein